MKDKETGRPVCLPANDGPGQKQGRRALQGGRGETRNRPKKQGLTYEAVYQESGKSILSVTRQAWGKSTNFHTQAKEDEGRK